MPYRPGREDIWRRMPLPRAIFIKNHLYIKTRPFLVPDPRQKLTQKMKVCKDTHARRSLSWKKISLPQNSNLRSINILKKINPIFRKSQFLKTNDEIFGLNVHNLFKHNRSAKPKQ